MCLQAGHSEVAGDVCHLDEQSGLRWVECTCWIAGCDRTKLWLSWPSSALLKRVGAGDDNKAMGLQVKYKIV